MGKPVTYLGTLTWEFGNSWEQDTMWMTCRRHGQTSVMSRGSCTNELHKTIMQNKMTSCPRMEITNDTFGCSRATQMCMKDLRLVNLTEICPSRGGECFKAPCSGSGWMKMRVNNQTKIADNDKLTIAP